MTWEEKHHSSWNAVLAAAAESRHLFLENVDLSVMVF